MSFAGRHEASRWSLCVGVGVGALALAIRWRVLLGVGEDAEFFYFRGVG